VFSGDCRGTALNLSVMARLAITVLLLEAVSAFQSPAQVGPIYQQLSSCVCSGARYRAAGARPAARSSSRAVGLCTMSTPVAVGDSDGACRIAIPASLSNTYFAVRHGHAVNNLERYVGRVSSCICVLALISDLCLKILSIISSSPDVGTKIHPLTELGKEQAAESSAALCVAIQTAV